jgi:hypothetical protein
VLALPLSAALFAFSLASSSSLMLEARSIVMAAVDRLSDGSKKLGEAANTIFDGVVMRFGT